MRVEEDSSRVIRSTARSSTSMPCPCMSSSTCSVTAAVTLGLPSRSPPVQVPKVSGRDSGSSRAPCAAASSARSVSSRGTVLGLEVVQVVGDVAGLLDRVGPVQPQLVGLPDEVDHGGQPAVVAAPGRR